MMLMIPGGYEKAARRTVPDLNSIEVTMKYNSALQQAGVLLALDGLHPPRWAHAFPSRAENLSSPMDRLPRQKRQSAANWIIEVKSKEEAIEWAKGCPGSENEVLEIRPMLELADFSEDVQKAVVAGHTELEEQAAQEAGA